VIYSEDEHKDPRHLARLAWANKRDKKNQAAIHTSSANSERVLPRQVPVEPEPLSVNNVTSQTLAKQIK